MNPEALVREIKDYITPSSSLDAIQTPLSPSSYTDPRDKEIASLKKDLILSARVGKSLLLQLHKMESQLASQETEFRARTTQLTAANGALVDENAVLLDQSRDALEQVASLETQIAQLSSRLADANSRCLRLSSYYSLAQSLEQQVEMLETTQHELRQDAAHAEQDRRAMEVRAKRAERLAEGIAANFRGLNDSAAFERPAADPLSFGDLGKPMPRALHHPALRLALHGLPDLEHSQQESHQDSQQDSQDDDTQTESLSTSSVDHIADLSMDSRFEQLDISLVDTSFASADFSADMGDIADTTADLGDTTADLGDTTADIGDITDMADTTVDTTFDADMSHLGLPETKPETKPEPVAHSGPAELKPQVQAKSSSELRPKISKNGLLPVTTNVAAVPIEADKLSKELPLRQKLSREPLPKLPATVQPSSPLPEKSTLAPHILAALDRPTLRRSQSHESIFSEYDSPALNTIGRATAAISGSAATAAPATNAATARERLLNVQQARKSKGWFMPFR